MQKERRFNLKLKRSIKYPKKCIGFDDIEYSSMKGTTPHIKSTPGSHLFGNIIELGGIEVPFNIYFKAYFSFTALCQGG